MRGLKMANPIIYKDGIACGDCTIIKWNRDSGELVFSANYLGGNYTLIEGSQSKITNNETTNASFYLFMKTQYWNSSLSAWVDEDIVINESTQRIMNISSILKLDKIWNAQNYSTSNLGKGDGTYRIYAAGLDNMGNVLMNADGTYANSTYNFTYDTIAPNVILSAPQNAYSNSSTPVNVTFECNATDNLELISMNLYITNSSNSAFSLSKTTGISGMSNSTRWTLSLEKGNYTWNCLAYDNAWNGNSGKR